jgi:hypothetical protein
MRVYEFHSSCWPLRALTSDISGRNLPAAYAPWEPQNCGARLLTLADSEPLRNVLSLHGFFLTSTGVQSSKRSLLKRPVAVDPGCP